MVASVSRLTSHTLVSLAFLCGFVVAPAVLLLRDQIGVALALGVGLTCLAIGVSTLLGAGVVRCVDRSACGALQWRALLVSAWLFNPVWIVVFAAYIDAPELAWFSAIPLGLVLSVLSGRLRLMEADADWAAEGCPQNLPVFGRWLCSRLAFCVVPSCLVSFQVVLYLPSCAMLPQGPEVGLFVCASCILISGKFCAMGACLARQEVAQAFVLVVLLSADWISSLHLMELLVDDKLKTLLLLTHLLVAGAVQLNSALARLRLRPRWVRAHYNRGVREVGSGGLRLDAALGAGRLNVSGSVESSDSDDDQGPGSLPDGFHACVVGLLGFQMQNARRQFLCPSRCALWRGSRGGSASVILSETAMTALTFAAVAPTVGPAPPVVDANNTPVQTSVAEPGPPPVQPTHSLASTAPSSQTLTPLEIVGEDRICTVCQDEIKTGDEVRPLPKCAHIFHAACLDRWAKTMKESTRCPTCRRPALARLSCEGSVSIASLASSDDLASSSSTSTGRSTRSGRPAAGRGGRGPGRGRGGGVRREARDDNGADRHVSSAASQALLRSSLGVDERFAQAALEVSRGAPDVAAHLVLEHRALLSRVFGAAASASLRPPTVPDGLTEAMLEANPDLADAEASLRHQLGHLCRTGHLSSTTWEDLSLTGKLDAFKAVLEDVVHRLEDDR